MSSIEIKATGIIMNIPDPNGFGANGSNIKTQN